MTAQKHPGWTRWRIQHQWPFNTYPRCTQDGVRYVMDQRRAFADNRRERLRLKRARRVLFRAIGRKTATKTTLAVEVWP